MKPLGFLYVQVNIRFICLLMLWHVRFMNFICRCLNLEKGVGKMHKNYNGKLDEATENVKRIKLY
ncbi:hypothetical protein DQQ01_15440 [Blautia argi]|uniref:Uncharacterized protein n=1 Tax=Blautia argi TaxID=1912897 RepID=A0A2Z4UEQ0_9FIRM|nr:hypothetical protein DQQ01_15440 [Blautia argi]